MKQFIISEMKSSKLDKMFKFISQYKYEINKNIPDNLKCGKCRNILINAYCISCGCLYCCDCVNEMLNNGVTNCPGQTKSCKDKLMSNNYLDYVTNKEISNVIIKCPEEMCLYKCAIINMEKHTQVCDKKSVKCPFSEQGCDGKKFAREMLNDHCQSANFNHCKILIEMIDSMRNEIDILKINNEINQLKFVNLEKKLQSKDKIIDKINKEIKSIKLENESIKQEFDSFKEKLNREIEEIDDKTKREDEIMKIEKDHNKPEFDSINKLFERKIQEKQLRMKSVNNETKSIEAMKMKTKRNFKIIETKVNELKKIIDYFGFAMIEWTIDKLNERRIKSECIWSKCFTGVSKKYKLQLSFYANGLGDMIGKGCSIFLNIWPMENVELFSCPFTADVTIKIIKSRPNISKSITKYCKINMKENKSWKWSEAFNYLYCDLQQDESIPNNCFTVECFVDFK